MAELCRFVDSLHGHKVSESVEAGCVGNRSNTQREFAEDVAGGHAGEGNGRLGHRVDLHPVIDAAYPKATGASAIG